MGSGASWHRRSGAGPAPRRELKYAATRERRRERQPAKALVSVSRTVALMLALLVVAAGVLAAGSGGAANAQRTIGLVLPDPNGGAPFSRTIERGGKSAAAALGDHLVVIPADGPEGMRSAVKSLIAQRPAAIVAATDQGPDT